MGKLLQKLLHGIVPASWLPKLKSSVKESIYVPSMSPSSSTTNNMGVLPLVAYHRTIIQHIKGEEPPSNACAESSVLHMNSSLATQGKPTSIKKKTLRKHKQMGDHEDHHHKHVDKKYNHKDKLTHGRHDGPHALIGCKRKWEYFQEQNEEEEVEQEDEDDAGDDMCCQNVMQQCGREWKKAGRGGVSCVLPESICCIVGNGRAVVKESQEPHMAMWESMVEMIVGNGLWEDMGNLEFLLFCYLSLNEPHLHPLIHSSFLQVLRDLEKTTCT